MRLKVRDFELKQIADSGQCFRWHELDAMTFDIVAHNRVLRVAQTLDTINLDCTEEMRITDIITEHSLKNGTVSFIYELDGKKRMRLIPWKELTERSENH